MAVIENHFPVCSVQLWGLSSASKIHWGSCTVTTDKVSAVVPTGSFTRSVRAVGTSIHRGISFIHRQAVSLQRQVRVACGSILSMHSAAGFPPNRMQILHSPIGWVLSIQQVAVLWHTEVPMCHARIKGFMSFFSTSTTSPFLLLSSVYTWMRCIWALCQLCNTDTEVMWVKHDLFRECSGCLKEKVFSDWFGHFAIFLLFEF